MDVETVPESPSTPPPSSGPLPATRDVAELVSSARNGDGRAWKRLIERYAPIVESVSRQYRLSRADAEDLSQSVWLRLFENLARLREPRAVPGWIKTTTRHEALHILAARGRSQPVDPTVLATLHLQDADPDVDHDLLRFERIRAISDGLTELASKDRYLLVLLHTEPRASYRKVSTTLGMPQGSIGPTRARCLQKLRKTAAIQTFVGPASDPDDREAA